MSIESTQRGIIGASGVATVQVGGRTPPYTATLTSTAGNRLIAFSTNHLATPAAPAAPDTTTTGMINFGFINQVTDIQFTGAPGDAYEV